MERDDLALIHRYLNGDLEGTELASFYQKVSLSPEMQESLARLSLDEALASEILSEQFAEQAEKVAPTRRRRPATVRRWAKPSSAFPWAWALAAAGVFMALAILASLSPSPSRRGAPAQTKEMARTEPSVQPDRPGRDEERLRDEARREAERKLKEIQEQRAQLEKAPPKPDGDGQRKAELERVRQIEADMKEFVKKLHEDRPAIEPPKPAPQPIPQETAEAKPRPGTVSEVVLARLERVEGEVFLLSDGNRQPVRAGQNLHAGQGLAVGAQGLVEVAYADKTRLVLKGDAELRDAAEPGSRGKRLFLAKGTVTAEVTKQPLGQPMIFLTPHGEARVLGTTLRIAVETTSTRLDVIEGKVRLTRTPDGKTVEVIAGHFAVAAAGVELATKSLPLDEIVLLPRDGLAVKANSGTWAPVPDKEASAGAAWHGTAFNGDQTDLKNCGYLIYRFRADADKDYHVWIRGRTTDLKNGVISDHLIIVVPDSMVTPSPRGAASLGGNADFNGFFERPGYWWVGGGVSDRGDGTFTPSTDVPVRIRFAQSGFQTLKVYAWEGPMRIDAIWLSTTQKTRPDANQFGPFKAGK